VTEWNLAYIIFCNIHYVHLVVMIVRWFSHYSVSAISTWTWCSSTWENA